MANIPDSGWLAALGKVELWISGAVASAAFAVWALWAGGVAPIQSLPSLWVAVIGVVGLLALALFAGRFLKLAVGHLAHAGKQARPKLAVKFAQLSDMQRSLILTVVATGRSGFHLPTPEPRWVEELCAWGYVDVVMVFGGDTQPYRLTDAAWEQVQRLQKAGRATLPDVKPDHLTPPGY